MSKVLLINSYPRSGSVFFSELLLRSMKDNLNNISSLSVIHVPELIGIKEAVSVVIVRDPVYSISSNIFKGLGPGRIFSGPLELPGTVNYQINDYKKYLYRLKNDNTYVVDFNHLQNDPIEEIKKLYYYLNVKEDDYSISKDDIEYVTLNLRENGSVYRGHVPRDIQLLSEYKSVLDYVKKDSGILELREEYIKALGGIKNARTSIS